MRQGFLLTAVLMLIACGDDAAGSGGGAAGTGSGTPATGAAGGGPSTSGSTASGDGGAGTGGAPGTGAGSSSGGGGSTGAGGEDDTPPPGALPAFPGAQGPGAESVGGRGGRVIEVTTLASDGPGSLRAAVGASGPRIVVFKVAGIIDLDGEDIESTEPYLTIAGQTAPEGGITLRGGQIVLYGETMHDFVVRFIRFRRGATLSQGDGFGASYGAHVGIVDHCSMSWANDEQTDSWGSGHDITWSWNIVAEGTTENGHSCGLLVGSDTDAESMTDYAAHHNLFAHNHNRSPLMKVKTARVINNVVYDWGAWGTGIDGGVVVDIVGNTYLAGPSTNENEMEIAVTTSEYIEAIGEAGNDDYGPDGPASIFVADNRGPSFTGEAWSMVRDHYGIHDVIDTVYQRTEPRPYDLVPITVHPAETAETRVLERAGASRRIGEDGAWIPARDEVDARIVDEVGSGTGFIPVHQDDVGGYPEVPPAVGYADGDHDGMADTWEVARGFDPADDGDGPGDADGDGYTNVEEFLNGTDPSRAEVGNPGGG